MLGRLHRFHGHNSVTSLYRRGETVRGPNITLKYSVRGDKPYRVSVVVSKKVSKSAVVRNRIRRRTYEIVRQHDTSIPAGADLLFSVFSDLLAEQESASLQANIVQLLDKVFSTEQPSR
jgi:ribonuclease P protein component